MRHLLESPRRFDSNGMARCIVSWRGTKISRILTRFFFLFKPRLSYAYVSVLKTQFWWTYLSGLCFNNIAKINKRQIQSTLVVSTSVISNYRLSRRKNLLIVLT